MENADVIKEGVNLGSYTQYSCKIGYWARTAVYFFTSQCNHDGLWEPDPTTQKCKGRALHCVLMKSTNDYLCHICLRTTLLDRCNRLCLGKKKTVNGLAMEA